MNRRHFALALLIVIGCPISQLHAQDTGSCPRTLPTGLNLGPPFPASDRWHGSDSLAMILPKDGIWKGMGPAYHYRDKLFWWSYGYQPGFESNFTVTGRSLDGRSAPADISPPTNANASSLGGWAMLVLVEFPDAGCWEITGDYLGHKLSFVVEIPGKQAPAATPATAASKQASGQ